MNIVKKLVLPAKILLCVIFCCTVVGMALFIGSEETAYARWLPQNLVSFYIVYQMLSAFGGNLLFYLFFGFFILVLLGFYLPHILIARIRKKLILITVCIIFSVLSLIDAVMMTRIVGFSMTTVADLFAALISVFLTVVYGNDKIRSNLS